MVTVPVRLLTGFDTVVVPMAEPVVGIDPAPATIPFMVIDQFCAPVALLCRQKSKLVMFRLYPEAILRVSVTVGVPPELDKAMASPELPVKLVHAPVLFDQEEADKFGCIMAGAAT